MIPVVDEDSELGREADGLTPPVFEKGSGRDDDGGGDFFAGRIGRVERGRAAAARGVGGRRGSETWSGSREVVGLYGGEQGEGLEGFSEAHFISEDAAEFGAVEVPEPSDTEALIRAMRIKKLSSAEASFRYNSSLPALTL